jgi:NAD dependent epimerase/dehydratase
LTGWAGRRVLVTGAGGFIGSHLCERLVELGAGVRALVEYNSLGSWGWLDESQVRGELEVLPGDIRDRDSARAAAAGAEVVLHLAALIAIPWSYEAPAAYVETNVVGTLNMLRAAQDAGVELFVQTSTSEVYGTARYVPIDEAHPLQAQSPYAASKIGADKIAESFHLSFGLPVATLRPFNTYGPRQSARAVIPTILTQLLDGHAVALGNLTPTRDFTYVTDTVEAFVQVVDAADAAVGRVLNVGSEREIAIGDLVERIETLVEKRVPVERDEVRVRPEGSEVERLCANAAEARRVLGWEPGVTLDDGLTATAEWIGSNLERYRVGTYAL